LVFFFFHVALLYCCTSPPDGLRGKASKSRRRHALELAVALKMGDQGTAEDSASAASKVEQAGSSAKDSADLFFARNLEHAMERKTGVFDGIAVLSAFLLAFTLGSLFSLEGDSFGSDFLMHLHVVCLVVATAAGLVCVLLLTFISAKIQRLLIKSYFVVGEDSTHADLLAMHSTVGSVSSLQNVYKGTWKSSTGVVSPCMYANNWYNNAFKNERDRLIISPRAVIKVALGALEVMLFTFILAVGFKLFDLIPPFLAATLIVRLLLSFIAVLGLLSMLDALSDLE
jgi:hypothetical protein